MRLTSYTNYALRSLQLAALRAPALVRVDDVVKVHGLARPHIVKIVHELGKAGFIETQRGRGGGFRLARAPEEIIVGEVVR
ncbi:Rrf2 family transcriptional regulator, partial [Hoeflea sp.]|uniref:Rrf2 family transcriptional regulator n=1 Tax=Hoeflea sp. TaxID=1940281 RepID=UPI0019B8F211